MSAAKAARGVQGRGKEGEGVERGEGRVEGRGETAYGWLGGCTGGWIG